MPSAQRVICLDTGHIYDSVSDAAKSAGITPGGITRAIQRGSNCRGYYYAVLPAEWNLHGEQIDVWCNAKRLDIIIKRAENKRRKTQ